jgi:uncharacterized protein (DUF433 family)/DNA-binding transcriptional MerR regulator
VTVAVDDVRFTVPLYSSSEAAGLLGVPASTFATWVKGYRKDFRHRATVTGDPLITGLRADMRGGPSIPFGGLAEGMFLSALRRAGVPLQQIRPALELVRSKLGIDHALASKRLYVVGAQLLWEVSTTAGVDADARYTARDLIVLRDGQYVFRQVIEQYMQRITYDDEYARRLVLPRYEVAQIAADPQINFGKPSFVHTGTPLAVVRDMLRAGEPIAAVADDFGLPVDQVTEVAQRERLLVA